MSISRKPIALVGAVLAVSLLAGPSLSAPNPTQYKKTVAEYEKTLRAHRKQGDANGIKRMVSELGDLAYEKRDYPRVIKYRREILRIVSGEKKGSCRPCLCQNQVS